MFVPVALESSAALPVRLQPHPPPFILNWGALGPPVPLQIPWCIMGICGGCQLGAPQVWSQPSALGIT